MQLGAWRLPSLSRDTHRVEVFSVNLVRLRALKDWHANRTGTLRSTFAGEDLRIERERCRHPARFKKCEYIARGVDRDSVACVADDPYVESVSRVLGHIFWLLQAHARDVEQITNGAQAIRAIAGRNFENIIRTR